MTTNFSATPTASAKIYTFPPRGRFALRVDDTAPAASVQLPRGVEARVRQWLVSRRSDPSRERASRTERARCRCFSIGVRCVTSF